jgi:hypothetical protein
VWLWVVVVGGEEGGYVCVRVPMICLFRRKKCGGVGHQLAKQNVEAVRKHFYEKAYAMALIAIRRAKQTVENGTTGAHTLRTYQQRAWLMPAYSPPQTPPPRLDLCCIILCIVTACVCILSS